MTQYDLFRVIVGLMILASAALSVLVSPWFLLFTAFIGANMFQSAFTHVFPMDSFIRRTGRVRPADRVRLFRERGCYRQLGPEVQPRLPAS
jgi:hypothetical protein